MTQDESLIREYFESLNARRLSDAAALYAPDAVIVQVPHRPVQRGGAGYLELAGVWLSAFPDAVVSISRVVRRAEGTYEVHMVSTGTHEGPLDLGSLIFQPTGARVTLAMRELLQIRDGRIVYSILSFDLQEMVEQLVVVDVPKVLYHLEVIRKEGERLAAAQKEPARAREIVERLGLEIDAVRHAVRPYFKH